VHKFCENLYTYLSSCL